MFSQILSCRFTNIVELCNHTYFWNDRIVVRYCFPTKISDIGVPEAGEVDGGVHGLAHSLLDIHRGDKQLVLTSLNL